MTIQYDPATDSYYDDGEVDTTWGEDPTLNTGTSTDTPPPSTDSSVNWNSGLDTSGSSGSSILGSLGSATSGGLSSLLSGVKNAVTSSGQLDYMKLLPVLAGLYSASKSNTRTQPAGYQGGIPKYTATRRAAPEGQRISGNVDFTPKVTTAATGGMLESGGFVIPADVVSHFGNGSSDAGLGLLAQKLGARPIRGAGDGMSDSIPTSIDGKDKALVAHEEAYMTPDKVASLGGGSPSKGAQQLRSMMANIRKARTGSTEQGRQIDPHKFMPGGSVQRFAAGDTTVPAGTTGTESSLSTWVGPYVTDMLAKGQALSEMPYEPYTGQLTAGPSALQNQAFSTAANLQTPTAIGDAAAAAGDISQAAQGLNYTPTTFTNQYTAPTQYTPTEFTNSYTAPTAYTPTDFTTDTFNTDTAQQYMNPYLRMSLDPQLAELQRQNQIADMADSAKLVKAGAYGGGRQAVMTAENTRNLMDKVNQLTGAGYNTAYTNAMSQFNADQARKLDAQKAAEASRQFGANQAMSASQLQAQYGLSAAQASELSRQFASNQGMTAAQLQAQYGLSAAQASELSRQFGSTYGLQSLQTALQAAQAQGQLGLTQSQADLNNLKALADLGGTQRAISAEDLAAQKAAFEEARLNPYKMVQFEQSLLSGLPLAAQTYNVAPTNDLSQFAGGLTSLNTALQSLGQTSTSTAPK